MAKNSYNNSSLRNEELNKINEKLMSFETKVNNLITEMQNTSEHSSDFEKLAGELNFIELRISLLREQKEKL